jgi:NADH dehydrogenase
MAESTRKNQLVAVTGATGFVGRSVVRALLARGFEVRVLVRDRAKAKASLPVDRLQIVDGDVTDAAAVASLVRGVGTVVHLVGIIREAGKGQTFKRMHVDSTRVVTEAARAAGVGRYLHMSAMGVGPHGKAEYQRTKFEAEQIVRQSGLDWTIFRPGLIHGPGGEFTQMAAQWARGELAPYVFMPYFRRWEEDFSVPLGPVNEIDPVCAPVYVEDVARAFVASLDVCESIGEVYNLAGAESMTFPDMLRAFRDATPGAEASMEPWGIPAAIAAGAAMGAGLVGVGGALPFDAGMAWMGGEDTSADTFKAREHLKIGLAPFREALKGYAGGL